MTARELSVVEARAGSVVEAGPGEWSIETMVLQAQKIQQCMQAVMKRDEHYGVIPGTQGRDGKPPKPTLLKPGAEKLCLMFRLDPEYDVVDKVETASLIRFTIRCTLTHIPTGLRTASGLGSCNSNEDKYLRPAPKKCTACGKEAVIKGSEKFGGGWLCWKKKDGCGKKWNDGDAEIEQQETGIKDPADLHNTILKMACKRALIAAVLNATAASDFFTQDLEDLTEKAADVAPKQEEDLTKPLQTSVEQAIANRDAKKKAKPAPSSAETAGPSEPTDGTMASDSAAPASVSSSASDPGPVGGPGWERVDDTGEAATTEQKDAIRLHIRKKGWKRGFVRIWFKELFGIDSDDPLEALTQMQADAAHFLVLAHGTANYRKIRQEYADQGLVKRDENDIQW